MPASPAPENHSDVNWSKFDNQPEREVACSCGAKFLAHAVRSTSGRPSFFIRKPCPGCGATRCWSKLEEHDQSINR